MISSATALVYVKSSGHPVQLHITDGPAQAAWGLTDFDIMRWFGAHGFRVDWSKGAAAISEGRGALQRYIQTWIEIGVMERVELIDGGYLTHGLVWKDIKGWEKQKLEKFQELLDEEA